MTTTTHRRMSATERLEQLRDFVATHERPPSRRIGNKEEKSLGEWIAKHKNSTTRTGKAVRELLAGGALAAPPVNDLEDYQKFCAKHMRAPMAATGVAREQALWEWARTQTDSDTVAAIAKARARCRVSTPGASQREKLGELALFAKTHRRPPSPHSKNKHERDLAEWVRINNVQAKSYLAREVERIYREHRADQHHAQRIAAGRLNGLVAFVAKTGRAPQLGAADDREAQLAKWAAEYCKDSTRLYASQVSKVLATAGRR
ncbi:hypothetical protein ACT4S5_13080 [Kocuria oceani]|uniref:hypothetical protein n=1 Tax=Kocuria oceani TaxID=988827 RepID=UPI004036E699